MTIAELDALLTQESKASIYEKGLAVAEAVDLPTTSWGPGDPTRTQFHFISEILAAIEEVRAEYVASGFLDFAEGDDNEWLILKAGEDFGVTTVAATFASTGITLTNNGGGLYVIGEGELIVKNSNSGATYHNVTGGTLNSGPGTSLALDVVADEAGSSGSAGPGEIDILVTGLLDVTVTNAIAAVGTDAESAPAIRDRCRDKLGSLSPNGPRDAYAYVAKTPELAGTSKITRVRTVPNGGTGQVDVYLAGAGGAVLEADRALAEDAIERLATPLGVTPVVTSATNVTIPVTYTAWIYSSVSKTSAEIQSAIAAALASLFAVRPIGGDVIAGNTGRIYHSMIESEIRKTFPDHCFRVSLTAPAGDTDLDIFEVAVLGTVTPTINIVEDPN